MRGLYICSFDPEKNTNSYFRDWAYEFKQQGFDIFNSYINNPFELTKIISPFSYDFIIFGYSVCSSLHGYSYELLKILTKLSRATIIGFLQNEFRNLPEIVKLYESLNVNILVSQLSEKTSKEIYKNISVKKVISSPHAMSTINMVKKINHKERKIDIGNRFTQYAFYTGNFARIEIIPKVLKKLIKYDNLTVDISENRNDRFNSDDWYLFLKKCKSTLSCESGSFFLQWNDELRKKINQTVKKDNNISFNNIFRNYLKKSTSHYSGNCVSARHFDAIACGTCNILIEGEYNNVFTKDLHFMCLKKNLSNFGEILEKLSDIKETERIAREALRHSIKFHTIQKRITNLFSKI